MSASELDRLEAESIHIMREVAAELDRPVLLFSGGKDSLVLLQLAIKCEFRDRLIEQLGEKLIVASV